MTDATLLITGGSTGIGAATARKAVTLGYKRIVLTCMSNTDKAEAVAQELRAAGAEAYVQQSNVADPAANEALFAFLATLPAAPLHLVNNAGIVSPTGAIADLTPDRVRHVFEVNVLGAIDVARHAVGYMRANAGGHIVNISSAAARLGSANQYIDYAATKGAIDTFTYGLADELAGEGIRVNGLRPGLIETEIHAKGGDADRLARIGHTPPLGRPGTADEIADGVLYLLSDAASYVTRTILDVAGGR